MNTRAIVFDFDGVLTRRGEHAKEEAWGRMLLEGEELVSHERFFRELARARADFAARKITGSRYDILKAVFLSFGCPREKLGQKVERYAALYNDAVQKLIREGGSSDGAREVLDDLSKTHALFVNSATPQGALEEALEALGLDGIFKEGRIFGFDEMAGGRRTKVSILHSVIEKAPCLASEMVFVGDGEGDWRAAEAVGCRFVGVATDWNKWAEGGRKPFPLITRLGELKDYL